MLTRPRTHVKSCLAFYRLKKIIVINLHSPCLCFRYLSLYLDLLRNSHAIEMLSGFWSPMCSFPMKKEKKKKKPSRFQTSSKASDRQGPAVWEHAVQSIRKHGVCFSRKNVLPGGCRMHSALRENTRTVSCRCVAFKCRHDGGSVDSKCAVFMYLRRGC